jgi:hypothetical protein
MLYFGQNVLPHVIVELTLWDAIFWAELLPHVIVELTL